MIPGGGFRQAAENDRFTTANPSCGGLAAYAPQSEATLDDGWLARIRNLLQLVVGAKADSWLVEAR